MKKLLTRIRGQHLSTYSLSRIGEISLVLFLLLGMDLLFTRVSAAEQNILIIHSGISSVYQDVTDAFQTDLKLYCKRQTKVSCGSVSVKVVILEGGNSNISHLSDYKLIITLGKKAAKALNYSAIKQPVLNALIPKAIYKQLNAGMYRRNVSAVYLDQPLKRQLLLSEIITPELHLGVLLGPTSKELQPIIEKEAFKLGIRVSYTEANQKEKVGSSLKQLLEKSNTLLAIPDPIIYSRETIINILLSSYHKKAAVIGFSSAYVKAGALAAVYSSPNDIGKHLSEIVGKLIQVSDGKLPNPVHPKYFSVEVNNSVAKSLGLYLPDKSEILKILSNGVAK